MRRGRRELVRCAASGVLATVVDGAALVALVEVARVHVTAAAFAASTLGAVVNFAVNRSWAFGDRAPLAPEQVARFAVVAATSAAVMAGAVHLLVVPVGLPYLAAKLAAAILVFAAWSFPLQARLVFPRRSSMSTTTMTQTMATPTTSTTTDRERALTIVIPAYNEARRIEPTIAALQRILGRSGRADHEILVVDDGSSDDTAAVVARLAAADPAVRLVGGAPNRGKGHAVRTGMLAARGRVRVMCDADGSVPAEELRAIVEPVACGAVDVAIGSRYAAGARVAAPQPLWRRAWSRLVNRVVQHRLTPGVRDTQCGFKAFSAPAAETVFGRGRIDGWAFDLEALAIALRLGLVVREVPVTWSDDARSRVSPVRDLVRVVREWRAITANLRAGAYGALPERAG